MIAITVVGPFRAGVAGSAAYTVTPAEPLTRLDVLTSDDGDRLSMSESPAPASGSVNLTATRVGTLVIVINATMRDGAVLTASASVDVVVP
jgi:hypothetical protein